MSNKIKNQYNSKMLGIIVALFITAFILIGVIFFSTRMKSIMISGLTRYESEEFLDMLGSEGSRSNALWFFLKNRFVKNDEIPFIGDYNVTLIDSNSVRIDVYENDIIACVSVMESYFCFDKEGRVVATSSKRPKGVPLVTGFDFSEIMAFEKLDIQKQSMIDTVLELNKLFLKYKLDINEISFNDRNEITLYTDNLVINLGKRKEYDTVISALSGVYKRASEIGGTVDLRNYSEDNTYIILKPAD